jgi:hypothetical protein
MAINGVDERLQKMQVIRNRLDDAERTLLVCKNLESNFAGESPEDIKDARSCIERLVGISDADLYASKALLDNLWNSIGVYFE